VTELLVDPDENKVRMLQVEHGGLFSIGATPVFIAVEAVQHVTPDEVRIDRSPAGIVDAPRYDPELIDQEAFYAPLPPLRAAANPDETPHTPAGRRQLMMSGASPTNGVVHHVRRRWIRPLPRPMVDHGQNGQRAGPVETPPNLCLRRHERHRTTGHRRGTVRGDHGAQAGGIQHGDGGQIDEDVGPARNRADDVAKQVRRRGEAKRAAERDDGDPGRAPGPLASRR